MIGKYRLGIISLLVIALLAAGEQAAFGQSKRDQQRSRELAAQGDKLFREKNYKAAADSYQQAIQLVANNPAAHYWKGVAHYYLKEYEPAERSLQTALTQGFKPLEVYRIRWYIYYDQKRFDEAAADLSKAIQLEPKNVSFLRSLGEIYVEQGRTEEALDTFQRSLLLDPKDADTYYNIARIHALKGNYKAQGAAADEALKRGTRMVGESYLLLADSRQRQGDIDGAIAAYQRAIAAKPGEKSTFLTLANLFHNQGRFAEAIETCRKGLERFPNDGDFYTDLAWYYSLSDRHDEAAKSAQAAVTLLPDQYMGYTNLCRAQNDLKLFQDAIRTCNSALRLKPNDGETLFYLARAYDGLNRRAEATPLYSRAVTGLVQFTRDNPEYPDGFYLLGNAYFADNQRDKAIDAYIKCLELNPRFAKARFNLGVILVRKKDRAGAMEQYNELLRLEQNLATRLKAEIDKM